MVTRGRDEEGGGVRRRVRTRESVGVRADRDRGSETRQVYTTREKSSYFKTVWDIECESPSYIAFMRLYVHMRVLIEFEKTHQKRPTKQMRPIFMADC